MTKFKIICAGFLGMYLMAACPVVAHAQSDQGSFQEHVSQKLEDIFSQLNLTDDQKKQLQANKQQHRARMQEDRQSIKLSKEALQEELMKPQLDMPKILKIHSQIKALQSKMEDDRLGSILAVRSILTSEQFIKFVTMMHQHKQERHK